MRRIEKVFTSEQVEEQIKHFTCSNNSEGVQDDAARALIADMHQLSRSNARAQHSVDLAWQRLVEKANQSNVGSFEEQLQHKKLVKQKSGLSAGYSGAHQKRSIKIGTWQRLGSIAAILIVAILLSSAVGGLVAVHLSLPQPGGHKLAVSVALGKSLADISLGMTGEEMVDRHGQPSSCHRQPSAPSSPRICQYANDRLWVILQPEVTALSISAPALHQGSSPFATAEGFHLGMSFDSFKQRYQHMIIKKIIQQTLSSVVNKALFGSAYPDFAALASANWFQVSDHQGTTLIAGFIPNGQSISLILQTDK